MRLLWGLSGEIVHLHATVNPESRRILLFRLYPNRSIMSVYAFMKVFIKQYGRLKLVWADGGSWYDRTPKWLRLKPQVISRGFRNRLERRFPTIKA
jgi:transposase-like protein